MCNNCNQNNRIAAPKISVTPSLGSTASPYALKVTIEQRLCAKVCAENVPVFQPTFTVLRTTNVGGNQYEVEVQVDGAINYVKCGSGCCGAMSQPLNATFNISVTSATVPTGVTIEKGATVNAVQTANCERCGRQFISDSFVTLTVA